MRGFPHPRHALQHPNGLLAIGGEITPECLLAAYAQGVFPWYNEGEPPLWWSPDPRCVLEPARLHVSKSLDKKLKSQYFKLTFNENFTTTIRQCATAPGRDSTWITAELISAWCELHRQGYAWSVEVWRRGSQVGGLYGMPLGRVFSGESMYSLTADASKAALVWLARALPRECLIDCQVESPHLKRLGATTIPRDQFLALLPNQAPFPPPDTLMDTKTTTV